MKKEIKEIGKQILIEAAGELPAGSLDEQKIIALVEKTVAGIARSLVKKEVAELALKLGLQATKRGLI